MIILLFGQPASGKTTIANALHEDFWLDSMCATIKIDGDRWRDITQNKDYSKEGRVKNLKGAFDMALYLEKEGYIPLVSFVTPYQELRDYLKERAEKLIQVFLTYEDDRGRNQNFAKDFETPTDCDLYLNTSIESMEECIEKIKKLI